MHTCATLIKFPLLACFSRIRSCYFIFILSSVLNLESAWIEEFSRSKVRYYLQDGKVHTCMLFAFSGEHTILENLLMQAVRTSLGD